MTFILPKRVLKDLRELDQKNRAVNMINSGSKGKITLSDRQLESVLSIGAKWAADEGYLWESDLDVLEENGCIENCSPEHVSGGVFSRAEWILQGASDMLRIDYFYGGITGSWKLINLCQAYGLKCELHGTGWPNIQLAAAVPEATCEYYERGLLRPGFDGNTPEPYLSKIADPIDDEGNIIVTDNPGLDLDLDWNYIDNNRVI